MTWTFLGGVGVVKSILLLRKPNCLYTKQAIEELIRQIKELSPKVLIAEGPSKDPKLLPPDLVITCGGDGTFLKAASYFPNLSPTFLPISGGTLGFMLPLSLQQAKDTINSILTKNIEIPIMERMRLTVTINKVDGESIIMTALNEVNIHRGSSPSLARMDCFVNGTLLTSTVSDGLLVSTPTGSTAYSLSAGGPVMHPFVEGILVTPVCPRSLSFRPAVLPASAKILVKVLEKSRAPVQVSVDGLLPISLPIGSELIVTRSKNPLKVVCQVDANQDWLNSINSLLSYNLSFNERIIEE